MHDTLYMVDQCGGLRNERNTLSKSAARLLEHEGHLGLDMSSKNGSLTLTESRSPMWRGLRAEDHKLSLFGMKLSGGGAHQSKTMMFRELEALIGAGASTPEQFRTAAIDENAIGKSDQ